MREWVEFVEMWVESHNEPPGRAEQLARAVLDDCIEHSELTHYRAHLIMGAFSDLRGYS